MTELDRITSGARETELVERLRRGELAGDGLARHGLGFFTKVQIQTTSYCNASCVTCPYPATSETQSMGRMSADLFESIVQQIAGRGVERTSLFLMNEPLVDKRLEDFTVLLKRHEPRTKATIITNGTLLDGARARALAAAGLDEISVSVNGFTAAAHESTMVGLDFARIVDNLGQVAAARREGSLGQMDVRIVALDLGDARAEASAFEAEIGLPVYLKPVTNRAGSVDTSSLDSHSQAGSTFSPCQRPFVKAYILFDGRLVLCNCDWDRSVVVGDVTRDSLESIWRGPVLDAIRRQHAERRLASDSLCAKCDYPYLL